MRNNITLSAHLKLFSLHLPIRVADINIHKFVRCNIPSLNFLYVPLKDSFLTYVIDACMSLETLTKSIFKALSVSFSFEISAQFSMMGEKRELTELLFLLITFNSFLIFLFCLFNVESSFQSVLFVNLIVFRALPLIIH